MRSIIEHNFKYHAPGEGSAESHQKIREAALNLALVIERELPVTAAREKATAITQVESAMMFACAGVCRHPRKPTADNAEQDTSH